MKIYDFKVKDNLGKEISLENYKGKTLIIVNTASKCGLTPQFEDLEFLYKKYKNENFEILGFPCNQFAKQELNSNDEIQEFCQLNYGVTFKVFDKINVNGKNAHPLYKYFSSLQNLNGLIWLLILIDIFKRFIIIGNSPRYISAFTVLKEILKIW